MPAPSSPALARSGPNPVLIFVLGVGLGLSLGLGVFGCSSSFCGAPCEAAAAKADAAKALRAAKLDQAKAAKAAKAANAEKAKAARIPTVVDTLPVIVNQYGSFFGHLEVDSMTPTQLRVEKTSLEVMLAGDAKDKEILKVLKEGKLDTTTFDYNDYSTGGSRYSASGKLRRDAVAQDDQRRLPRMISESQNRELIERYRLVRRRMSRMPVPPVPVSKPAADTLADNSAGSFAQSADASDSGSSPAAPSAAPAASQGVAISHAAASAPQNAPPVVPVSAPRPDSVWTGRCRANGDTLAIPETFKMREACEAWGREKSGEYREKAFSFECECVKDGGLVKRKFW
jgi:hypothetical protein